MNRLKNFENTLKIRIEVGHNEDEVSIALVELKDVIASNQLDSKNSKIESYSFRLVLHNLGILLLGSQSSAHLDETIAAWKSVKLEILFREYELYNLAIQTGNQEDFFDDYSVDNGSFFIEQVWALCGLYYFDIEFEWPISPIMLLKTAELRGDIDFNLKNNDEFPWLIPLVEFLYSNNSRDELIEQLASFERFKFIKEAWHDDVLFKQGIETLCEYHIEKCQQAYKTGSYYPVEHYALFPVWIYALDKCREREIGRSALPDNPLMAYGEKVKTATFEQKDDPVLAEIDAFYTEHYADKNIDFYEFWKQFKANK